MFRREDRYLFKAQLCLFAQRIAQAVDAGIEQADDVAGIGLLHHGALVGHELLGSLQLDLLAGAGVPGAHVPLEFAADHAHKGQAVAVGGVHVGLDLEHKARELRPVGRYAALIAFSGRRGQGVAQKAV